mmetsp:Transcript_1046/g.1863  ORF Transcript_1046/g.1863 Transcript_1046/m.1863 type:complete len:228 (-) Transcript_1046:69-752(-)|eukprot:CAMPEP_0176496446 /NCGR_PEP_ID=MMETSP0200_2-20121128/11197_1 /TAXON_ID=947934 /ORGANISM="Chaetoceros sp., Strain GSL56" /LENGTH=227 /DNA_ID=CAMNT_0017894397 /DNA_START=1200 /DNA_END=1883 /DNA_ORIENTATION=+
MDFNTTGTNNVETLMKGISSNDDEEEEEGQFDTTQMVYAFLIGIYCTILLCIVFMPLAKKWDKFITKILAGKTSLFRNQYMGQDRQNSGHVSDVIMVGNSDSDVSESQNLSLGEKEEEEHQEEEDQEVHHDWVQQMVNDLTRLERVNTVPSSIRKAWTERTTCVKEHDQVNPECSDDESRMSCTLFLVTSEDDEMIMDGSFSWSDSTQFTGEKDISCVSSIDEDDDY